MLSEAQPLFRRKSFINGRWVGLDNSLFLAKQQNSRIFTPFVFLFFAPSSTFRFSLMGKASLMG
ncbi:MAG: hypothetical protein IJN08_02970, partial [Clostridia bacterium]|nr:hypothetical protein [Clostridia bacterium]